LAPWGIGGGRPGGRSEKVLHKADGTTVELPSKLDHLKVGPGDRLVFRTAGAGGWGDPLERPAAEVLRDVSHDLVDAETARAEYGVVIADGAVDEAATQRLREERRIERGAPPAFDFGELPEGLQA
jgi:N-methylhydantoinase B